MARAGDEIVSRLTGERFVFRRTAQDTGGELLELDVFFGPRAQVPAEHLHPEQEERFEIVSGRAAFRLGTSESSAGPGEVVTVPAGTRHSWWNPGDEEIQVRVQFRPALEMERFFETIYGLMNAGKTNSKGMPNPLRMAVIAQAYEREMQIPPQRSIPLSRLPRSLQRVLVAVLAPLGRMLGYRA